MDIPNTPTALKGAFKWQTLVVILIVALIVSYAMSKILKTELTLTDNNGNVTGKATETKNFSYSVNKTA